MVYGPSTRCIIDFADASQALGINPVGQSGVLFDTHHADQAKPFVRGQYVRQHVSGADVAARARSTVVLQALP